MTCSLFFFFLLEICVQRINELSQYQMIWNDEDGFLLKPLGIIADICSQRIEKILRF